MSLTNEKLTGHIAFLTETTNFPPVPLPGLAPNDSTAYNIRVDRQLDNEDRPVAGGYVLTIGEALAPPSDESADIDITSSMRGAFWTNATATDIGTDAQGNRLYQINVVENSGPGGLVVVSDSAGVVIRFSIRRVNPRRT